MAGRWVYAALVSALLSSACGGPPSPADPAALPPAPAGAGAAEVPAGPGVERENPPPPGPPPEWSFPMIRRGELDNGLSVWVVERHGLPVVEAQLVVLSGSAADGDDRGIAMVTGELLKAGGAGKRSSRELLHYAESLGSSLSVMTERDATSISMGVLSEYLSEAFDVIAALATKPRMNPNEFEKLKRREMERVSSLARSSAPWAAAMVLYRELYQVPSGTHPYSSFDSTVSELAKIQLAECRSWHRTHFTPKNAFLLVVGDATLEEATAEARRAFGDWKGDAPPGPAFAPPTPPAELKLFLVDRPESPQAEIYVATLGPVRQSDEWATVRTANQILGGGVAGRLFLDVREKRSLAYRTRSEVEAVAHGPVPIVLTAGTQTAKAGLALGALLEHFEAIGGSAPSPEEVAIATRFLSDVYLLSVDTVGAVAGLTVQLGVMNLPDDYYDRYRERVRRVTAEKVQAVGRQYFERGGAVVVVAGDAERLGKPLSRFGTVRVVDPEEAFATKRTIPHDPAATLELERIEGT